MKDKIVSDEETKIANKMVFMKHLMQDTMLHFF